MSMSKGNAKHMSAESEKSFEEKLEGQDFGDIDDWASHLGTEILGIENKIHKSEASGKPNVAVISLLNKRLAVYNAALSFIDNNPKAAALVGDGKGVKAVVSYIVSKAQEQEAENELSAYIAQIKPHLPGHKLNKVVQENVVLRGNAAAAASSSAPK
jgi:hypothetical protein